MYYFAWVDAPEEGTEIAFDEAYAREDEKVFSFTINHKEGDFPSLNIAIQNPRAGLLSVGRKRWAWLATDEGTEVTPLFFGRLVGVPKSVQGELITLEFIARPVGFDATRYALAQTLKVAPYWDALFIPQEDLDDPDRVLEARTQLWHVDRVTHDVTVSDIVTPEDGALIIGEDAALYEFLDVSFTSKPARRAEVSATFGWTQIGSGTIDVTQALLLNYKTVDAEWYTSANGYIQAGRGGRVINLVGAAGMVSAWPKTGADIGGGWKVGTSALKYIEPERDADGTLIQPEYDFTSDIESSSKPGIPVTMQDLMEGHRAVRFDSPVLYAGFTHYWFPIVPTAPRLELDYEASRDYSESITFAIDTDVQALFTDNSEDEILSISVPSVKVDAEIEDVKRRSYLQTDRGLQSIEHLIARARAELIMRARAVEVNIRIPFSSGLDLSCRKGVSLTDYRLPGGSATGKITEYILAVDGQSGASYAEIKIGCAIGRGGSLSGAAGTPTYVDTGYVLDYQAYSGEVAAPFAGAITYNVNDVVGQAVSDDGKDLNNISALDYVVDITVTGGLAEQETTIKRQEGYYDFRGVFKALDDIDTITTIELIPVNGGPFLTEYSLTVSALKVPTGIDLEAVA